VVLFHAGFYVAGGFMVILLLGMTLFIFHLAGGADQTVAIMAIVLTLLGGLAAVWACQRFFLYRQKAALLFLFSGRRTAAPGLSGAVQEAGRVFPDFSSWVLLNRRLRRVLAYFYRKGGEFLAGSGATSGGLVSKALDLLAAGMIGQAIISLAFAREGDDVGRSSRESVALFFQHGDGSRRLGRRWLCFSGAGLVLLFLCLAVPNWFFFRGAGAPVGIGIALAAAIAWLLHQAFVVPLVLAGVSTALLAETRGQEPDPALCAKVGPLVTP
jgi:hypothetical protein